MPIDSRFPAWTSLTQNLARALEWLRDRGWPWAVLVFAVTLAAYARTLLPGAAGGDAGEMQYAGPLFTLTHATGYPLYVLLGFIWSNVVPIGSMAYRMNLLSAVSAALGCAVTAYMLYRQWRKPVIAVASALTLGFGGALWAQADAANKYSFNMMLTALVVGLALWWAAEREQPHGDRLLYALCLAFGVSLLHHRSMLLLAPGLALLAVGNEGRALWRDKRRTLICAALVCGPALLIYPPVLFVTRNRALEGLSPVLWKPQGLTQWATWMLDQPAVAQVFVPAGFGDKLLEFAQSMLSDYTVVAPLVAALGLAVLARKKPVSAAFLLITYALQVTLAANYRDYEHPYIYFSLPSSVALIYAYGHGLAAIQGWVQTHVAGRGAGLWAARAVLPIAALALPAAQFSAAFPARLDAAEYGPSLDIWRQTLESGTQGDRMAGGMTELPRDAIVLADWEQVTILWQKQRIDGMRPDLQLVYPIESVGSYTGGPRPVCVTRHIDLDSAWHLTSVGSLVCLSAQTNRATPQEITLINKSLVTPDGQPRLELVGFSLESDSFAAPRHVPLILVWRALVDHPEDYAISLHILTEAWQQVSAQDIAAPALGMFPTSRWALGEVVSDYHELDVPRAMAPGRYLWTVVVYRQAPDGSFVQLHDAEGNVEALGGTFEVK